MTFETDGWTDEWTDKEVIPIYQPAIPGDTISFLHSCSTKWQCLSWPMY